MTQIIAPAKLIHGELSFLINGIVFETFNELGFGYQEKYYYRSLRNKFKEKGLKVQEQLLVTLVSGGKPIGRYFLDFLIEDKIVLELKVANQVYPRHIKQVLGYLKAKNLQLGIIAVFTKHGVILKRVLN